MSAKRKKQVTGVIQDNNETVIIETPEEETATAFELKVEEWIDRVNIDDVDPIMYVYKYRGTSFSGNRELCGKFRGADIPDEHTIGLNYGSGNYRAIAYFPPTDKHEKEQTSFSFVINSCYDQMRKEMQLEGTLPHITPMGTRNQSPVVPQIIQGGNGRSEMAMFKEALAVVSELFGKMIPQQQPSMFPDMSKLMIAQYTGMGEVLKQNLLSTDAFMQQALKKNLAAFNNDDSTGNEIDPDASILERLAPELAKALPALLSNPSLAKILGSIITGVTGKTVKNLDVAARKKAALIKKKQQFLMQKKRLQQIVSMKRKKSEYKPLEAVPTEQQPVS